MEALQILNFSIWKGRPLKFTEGMSWKEELKDFGLLARTAPLGDAEAYGHSLEEPEGDSDDLMDELGGLMDELEMLGQEIMDDLQEDSENLEDDEDIYL